MNKLPLSKLLTSETTNHQLMEVAKRLGLHINNIVYADQLRYVPAKEGSYIINLKEPMHWTALHINGKKAFYFNSFSSLMPIPKEVIQFMKRCHCIMYYDSDKAVQSPYEGHCGEYAIDFLIHMNRRGNPVDNYERFLSHLHNTTKETAKYIIRRSLI